MDVKTWVIVVGLLLGAVLVVAVVVVGIKKKGFAYGEILMAAFGVVLVGLSLWSNVSLELGGFKAEFNSLQQTVEEVASAAAVVSEEVGKLGEAAANQQNQVAVLTRGLSAQTLDARTRASLQRELEISPRVDVERLTEATRRLEVSADAVSRLRARPPG